MRDLPICRHGFHYGDCPESCLSCGHRCELHATEAPGACTAFDCACVQWTDSQTSDGDDGAPYDAE